MNQSDDNETIDKSDFIYKLTNDIKKIPVFLNSKQTAVIIFKIGCDLNLLKTKRQEIVTDSANSMVTGPRSLA